MGTVWSEPMGVAIDDGSPPRAVIGPPTPLSPAMLPQSVKWSRREQGGNMVGERLGEGGHAGYPRQLSLLAKVWRRWPQETGAMH